MSTTADAQQEQVDVGRHFCDLVLKGGITSGVAFPTALARLSSQYRFRNIGGTSAGAIAAAAAAAAEYRRATDAAHPAYGFDALGKLPALLGERSGTPHSRLFHLFRPEPGTRKHFAILTAMLNRERLGSRVLRGLLASVREFPLVALAGALPGVVLLVQARPTDLLGVVAMLVAAAILVGGTVVAAVIGAIVSLVRVLPQQEFGLSRGYAADATASGEPPALTDWLYAYLQDIAGKDRGAPLTFADLDAVVLDEARSIRGIHLEMMTTALSMGRPFSLPFRTSQFYYRPADLQRYFPQEVMDWMATHPGRRSARSARRDEAMREFGYLPVPSRETLPVIVTTRMSLSFPLLMSGVPLYRYAWESAAPRNALEGEADAEESWPNNTDVSPPHVASLRDADALAAPSLRYVPEHVQKVVFSDGGICSNFPVQLFDSVLPAWPTFGINLRDDLSRSEPRDSRASLPAIGQSLPPEHYAIGASGAKGTIAFASAIIRTMQNWRDNLQRAAPGFRDRIVTIRHTADEGGLNLDMTAHAIGAMADSGALGAEKIIAAFARPETDDDDHFTHHRWIRVRSLLSVLQASLREIHDGITTLDNHPPYPDLIRDAPAYIGASYRLSVAARNEAAKLLDALDRLSDELEEQDVAFGKTAPRPEVELRIQPVL